MSEAIESPLLRVPFESLKRTTRERKYVLEEIDSALASLQQAAARGDAATREQCLLSLDALLGQLQGLKRKLADISASEADDTGRCRARLAHLEALGPPAKERSIAWNRARLDRLLVDYLLRAGYHGTADALAQHANVEALVDAHVFAPARTVVAALRSHNCAPALAWCAENGARLKKARSPLEFKLRVQEFVELVRADERLAAIQYARRHLAPWAGAHMAELQRAMGVLAFPRGTRCAPYSALFEQAQWAALAELFLRELYRLHAMPLQPLLAVHLQAGLSALKTPASFEKGGTREDPLHRPTFQRLAEALPFAKHVHSKLICSVTKEVMNEHNPPMALPNGNVYSERAVRSGAERSFDGAFVDPHTGEAFALADIRRVYIS